MAPTRLFVGSMGWVRIRLSAQGPRRARRLRGGPRSAAALMGLGLLAALFVLAPSAAIAAAWSPEKSAEADAIVTRFLARLDAADPALPEAALALSIGIRGDLALAKGYGEAAPGVPATAHTVFHIGSIAKQFTAAAVLDLIARNARLRSGTPLALDLALSEIFDGVEHWARQGSGAHKYTVTLRNLLTMTSNLPNFTRRPPADTNPWGRIGAPQLLSEVKKFRPGGWPNSFEYSNTSYFLLSEVIEEAVAPGEARPLAHHDYIRRIILPRAGLAETGFIGDYPAGAAVALPVGRRVPVFHQPNWLKGSADMASTAADLFAWNTAFMEGRVLPAEFSALMISGAGRVSPELYYGMGWFVEYRKDREIFSHSGTVPGYTSYNLIAAETGGDRGWTSVTLLINTDIPEGLSGLAEDLLRLALQ